MTQSEKISKQQLAHAMFSDFDKMEKKYEPTEEELKIIIEQTSSTETEAKEYFHKIKAT